MGGALPADTSTGQMVQMTLMRLETLSDECIHAVYHGKRTSHASGGFPYLGACSFVIDSSSHKSKRLRRRPGPATCRAPIPGSR